MIGSVILAPVFSSPAAELADRIVAIVNDEVITQSELDRSVQPLMQEAGDEATDEEFLAFLEEAEAQALDRLVTERLLIQEAKRQQIQVPDHQVEQELGEMRRLYPSEEAFLAAVSQQGLTIERLRERIRERHMVRQLIQRDIKSRVVVSPKEVMEHYVQHADHFVEPEKYHVRHILVKITGERQTQEALAIAHRVLQELHAGAPFAELAKQYSDTNAESGGDLGLVERGQLMKELDAAIFQLAPGKQSGIIQTPLGYHIVHVEDIAPKREQAVKEVWPQIESELLEQRFQQRFREWLDRIKARSYIAFQ